MTSWKWYRSTVTHGNPPITNPEIEMTTPMYAFDSDAYIHLDAEFDVPLENGVYIWKREMKEIHGDGSIGATLTVEIKLNRTSGGSGELWEERVNGGSWSPLPPQHTGYGLTNLLTYDILLSPAAGTYEHWMTYPGGGPDPVLLGKQDIRALFIDNIKPPPFDPEESAPVTISADIIAYPPAGTGRVFQNGWAPATFSWYMGLDNVSSVQIGNTTQTPQLDPNSGRIFTISKIWDGKLDNGRYATKPRQLYISAEIPLPPSNPELGDYPVYRFHRLVMYHRDCSCNQEQQLETNFSQPMLPGLNFEYQSFRAYYAPASMGYGWTSLGSSKLVVMPSGDLVYRDEAGMVKRWVLDNGNYLPVREDNFVLAEAGGSAAYRLTFRSRAYRDYNSVGQLVSEADRSGNLTTYTYNLDGFLESVSDGRGHSFHYDYGTREDGQPIGIRSDDPVTGRLVQLEYIPDTDPLSGRLFRITDPAGEITEFEYDTSGRLSKRIEVRPTRGNRTTEYRYTAQSELLYEIIDEELWLAYQSNWFADTNRLWMVSGDLVNSTPDYTKCGRDVQSITDDYGRVLYREQNQHFYNYD